MIFQKLKSKLNGISVAPALVLILALTTGCGPQTTEDSDTGQVVIGLTDAPGDFVSYNVDVVALELTKANGAVIQTLPVATRVDFAQYTEMTEFLTAATIPTGTYVNAKITLDYRNADIQIEDNSGNAVAAGTLQDESGNTITTLELNVKLEDRNSLFIGPGVPAHLTLDFDLSASHSVDLSGATPVVTVQPFLQAEVDLESPKIHRARGALKSVDVADSGFRLIIRPFIHLISGGDENFGTLKVTTNNETVYDINGSRLQGGAGLDLLNQQNPLIGVIVLGDLKFNPVRFEARAVMAGSSVPGGDMDVVSGNVISRSGNVFTVKGATLVRAGGSVIFNDQVQVTVGDNTVVRRQMSMETATAADISIGQRISVFGALTNASSQNLELDATDGYAHMQLTTLRATVVSTSPALVVELQSIDGRRLTLFDFTGSGAQMDADPTAYQIDSGTLDLTNINTGTVVKLRGFVTPFGTAADPDFSALTIIDLSKVQGVMAVGWPATSTTALSIDSVANTVSLDLNGTGLFHHYARGGVAIDLKQLTTAPVLRSNVFDLGLYYIRDNGTWQLHLSFSNYLNDLQARLNNGSAVRGVVATGLLDEDTGMLTSGFVMVQLN
ncbi:MAG: DUF4382 domain-containing protein [Gammaproteobacteria bacterium]|nr:DUF4382 domain-containing protein [Gammaproteobacteria bacterium]MDH5800172.1 DUF4382 domain-containing protein [Gammaproteobacteria bacterium]